MVVTRYRLQKNIKKVSGGQFKRLRIALAADLHDRPYEEVISLIKKVRPDMIAVPGDLMRGGCSEVTEPSEQENALGFLMAAAAVAPTFYSLGNHERFTGENGFVDIMPIVRTGAVLLDDAALQWKGINIGGLSSAAVHVPLDEENGETRCANRKGRDSEQVPNLRWLDEFNRLQGFKILLCHQPEYYPLYVKATSADIVLSGHAHGGQWRFFGHGVFAPGQGMFPRLTSGVHDNRLVISRGLSNTTWIPRIGNPPELVVVDVL
ncbi:MAG: metallophosphoesterase [Clostridiales bacterium]|nr:metallophosphoesterase [Clostridiales bacterium]